MQEPISLPGTATQGPCPFLVTPYITEIGAPTLLLLGAAWERRAE